ncbi:glycosyltransferase family 2 protein [Rossellomorea oryzaecorticis]|uniref:Glycosyltransferase family 2 protein n=1 Tax=Rossellomorea oryzaecorticis TaxID=1396505 RepID=A0ABU9K4Y6_9BACI
MKKILVVVPVYNRIDDTLNFLGMMRKQTYKNFNVIICDDNSIDGTYEKIEKNFPEVSLEKGNGDLWWTGGTNKALKTGINKFKDYDFILTINNDVKIKEDFLEKMVDASEIHPNALICATSITEGIDPKILFGGVRKINWYTAKYLNWFNKKESYKEKYNERFRESAYLIGRGMLVPRMAFEEVGYFNSKLPQYLADTDYSLKAKKKNYNLLVDMHNPVFTTLNEDEDGYKESLVSKFKNKRSPYHWKSRFTFANENCPNNAKVSYILFDVLRLAYSHFKNSSLKR